MPLICTMSVYALVFWLLFILWSVSELLGPARWSGSSRGAQRDRSSTAVIAGCTAGGILLSILCTFLFPQLTLLPLFYLGIVCVVLGTCYRWYAIKALGGEFFTGKVIIAPDHRLIERGPYRYLRHPSYTGILCVVFGFGLMMANCLSAIVITLGMFCGLLYRMKIEEMALLQALGEDYRAYMRRTWRLIPLIY